MSRRPSGAAGAGDVPAAVLDALPISLYVVDRRLRVVVWNRERERGPRGQPRGRVLGRPLREALTARGFRDTRPHLLRIFATGVPQEDVVESGGERLFHVRRLPLHAGRRVTHVLSLFEDITEQRALEMRVIASDRLAYLGQLVAGVAHEISNPLAGIAGCAEILASLVLREGAPTPGRAEAAEFRDLIRDEVARCERLIRSLLEAARPSPDPTADLSRTVREALRLLERHPAFVHVKVRCRMDEGLPPARIEKDSLKQVVMTLAVNAARAMEGRGTLSFRGSRQGRRLRLEVTDTGPGVPTALRKQIFKPYVTTDPGGTGLGLAIARSLVRGRGGDLTYRPRRRGAAFRVELGVDGR